MNTKPRLLPAAAAAAGMLLVGAAGMTGCAPAPRDVPARATEQLNDIRDNLVMGKAALQKASNSARDLLERPRADLQPQVDRFGKDLAELDAIAAKGRQQAAAARQEAEQYFADWDAQMQTMSRSLAEAGGRRQQQAENSLKRLRTKLDAFRGVYRPYYTKLSESQRYLATDTTAAGLRTVEDSLRSTLRQQSSVEKALDELIAEIDEVRAGR